MQSMNIMETKIFNIDVDHPIQDLSPAFVGNGTKLSNELWG